MSDISVFEDKVEPGLWRVEDNDYGGDGGCTVTLFAGPDAEQRARDYTAWLDRAVAPPARMHLGQDDPFEKAR